MTQEKRPKENVVKERVRYIIHLYEKYNKVYHLTVTTFGYGGSGHPDRLVLINGYLIGVELKRDRNNPHTRPELKASQTEKMQKLRAKELRLAGGSWVCIYHGNYGELVELLDAFALVGSEEFSEADKLKLNKLLEV